MESDAAKETQKANAEEEKAELNAVKSIDNEHQKALKEQLNLDKEEASARKADQEAQAKLDKAGEDAAKRLMLPVKQHY